MSKVVNLRQARKGRARADAQRLADENAARHGVPKALRESATREADKLRAALEAHKREP